MTTLKTSAATFKNNQSINLSTFWTKYIAYADHQKTQHLLWWLISLLIHCLLVPLSFLMSNLLNGPTSMILGISMILFFINVVGNMSGASTRFTILSFFVSLAVHIIMICSILV
ncbi:hypothetical protein WG906_16985 [Pedobacter sp. P351]|uniref:hypothetical protein n=1 Tax=Pedobacter superstes TaxID=3133441 RepID=UPI0030A182C1